MARPLRVAIIAPPWLAMPIKGYGGIELVVQGLIYGLIERGIEVEVFGNGLRTIRGIKTHSLYKEEEYKYMHLPLSDAISVSAAHMQFALNYIREHGNFDVIHDHNLIIGPQLWALASELDPKLPPIIHTHHGPHFSNSQMLSQGIPDNRPFWDQLSKHMGNLHLVGISEALMASAPSDLKSHILPAVYNAIDPSDFPFMTEKSNYFITLARFTPDKAQHVAAKLCAKLGYRLRMAGTVAGIETSQKLLSELASPQSPYRGVADFRYYSDQVLPYVLKHPKITYSGNISGVRKGKFIAHAKALLFPINWEEPFGVSVIEALACGTPVVAMNRGAMSEIIDHGVTGFLANNEEEFEAYMQRVGEIDPAACRASVTEKFSIKQMSEAYIERYKSVIK